MKMIAREDSPRWYELGWRAQNPALLVRIHQEFVQQFPICKKEPVAQFQEEFQFPSFSSFGNSLNEDFGFNQVLQREAQHSDFVHFALPLPLIEKEIDEPCLMCRGRGKRDEERCMSCSGIGKETVIDWNLVFPLSATLTILFSLLNWSDYEPSGSTYQLMTVETMTHQDMHGSPLWGVFGKPIVKWLETLGNARLDRVSQVIRQAYEAMLGKKDYYDEFNFHARVNNGRIDLVCPGDACGVYGDTLGFRNPGEGYKIQCHNMDNPMQQLSLLAGLGALHDMARQYIG